jgi:hypothetical protein
MALVITIEHSECLMISYRRQLSLWTFHVCLRKYFRYSLCIGRNDVTGRSWAEEQGQDGSSKSKFEVTLRLMVSQSACLGVEPTLGLVTRYYFLSGRCSLNVGVSFLCDALSGERTGLQFAVQSLNDRTELVIILYCLIWDSPKLESQTPLFISPGNRVAQLYPRALGSLYVASYDSQGYGGSILTRVHTDQMYLRETVPVCHNCIDTAITGVQYWGVCVCVYVCVCVVYNSEGRFTLSTLHYNIVHLHPLAHCYYTFTFSFRLCAACQCLKHFIVFSTLVTF